MFWGCEHVSQEDVDWGKERKHNKDENVSNVSSDNERLTKECFYSSESSFLGIFSLFLCLHNLNKYTKNVVKVFVVVETSKALSQASTEKLLNFWFFPNVKLQKKFLHEMEKVFSLLHEDSAELINNFEAILKQLWRSNETLHNPDYYC